MQFDHPQILPYLVALLAVWPVYRRLRRSFGRQRLQPARMMLRVMVLLLLTATLLPSVLHSIELLTAVSAGAIGGIGLGWWGARRTRYLMDGGQLHYVPHTYTGLAVSVLFVGRLAYRVVELAAAGRGQAPGSGPTQDWQATQMIDSPFTGGLLSMVIGYYVFYYSAVLLKSKRISPEDLEVDATSMPPSQSRKGAASG